MFLNRITLIVALAILATPIFVQAGLVDTLHNTSLCSGALNVPDQTLNNTQKPYKIDCLTLKNYFDTIDRQSDYRSFERARALVNAQRILNILAQQYGRNQDVIQLRRKLNSAFYTNFQALGPLTQSSVLDDKKPLRSNERIFFFGVQQIKEGLYVLEGRKLSNKADFVDRVITPVTGPFPTNKPLSLRVGNRFFSVDELYQAHSTGIRGFYITSIRVFVRVPKKFTWKFLDKMGREIAARLNISVNEPPQTQREDMDNPVCQDLTTFSNVTYRTKQSLNLRSSPNPNIRENILTALPFNTIIYPLLFSSEPGIWRELTRSLGNSSWRCVKATVGGSRRQGWVNGGPTFISKVE
jgi:hypothetical protein